MNVELQKISIWFKANKFSLNLTKTNWTLFHWQKKKCLIANDLSTLYVDNFEIVRESLTKFLGTFIDEWKPSLPAKMKVLSILAKGSWKTEIKLFL